MSAKTDAFIKKLKPVIQAEISKRGWGVCSAILAQAANESGWGQSSLASKYNNYFGMKCGSYWTGKSVNMATAEEYQAGTYTNIRANFRVYDTLEEGIAGYFDFLMYGRYAAVRTATDYVTYISELKKAGYATSSSYIKNLCAIVEDYKLTQYDTEKVTVKPSQAQPTTETIEEVRATIGARSLDKAIAGKYKVTATGLNIRNGAGTNQRILVCIPNGTVVNNYGYYTNAGGRKWLYVQFIYNGVKYTGFAAGEYLKEV